jgi:hypothetical protein
MKAFRMMITGIMLGMMLLLSCEKEAIENDPDETKGDPTGTLHVIFRISHPWLPPDRIVRTDLHVAKDGVEIYKGNYIQSANVTDFQDEYFFYLPPGTYYYEAGIACICEGDSCSAGGFPGNQYGGKFTMDRFTIYEDQVTTVIPTFQ